MRPQIYSTIYKNKFKPVNKFLIKKLYTSNHIFMEKKTLLPYSKAFPD